MPTDSRKSTSSTFFDYLANRLFPRALTPEESAKERLSELLNRRPTPDPLAIDLTSPADRKAGRVLPAVPPPPMFRAGTLSGPDPDVARLLEDLYRAAPELRGRASRVQVGPTGGVMSFMNDRGVPTDLFPEMNLLGLYSRSKKDIGLNPSIFDKKWQETIGQPAAGAGATPAGVLAHELAHATGIEDGDARLTEIEELAARLFPYPRPRR